MKMKIKSMKKVKEKMVKEQMENEGDEVKQED